MGGGFVDQVTENSNWKRYRVINMKIRQSNKIACKAGIITASMRRDVLRKKMILVRKITVQTGLSMEGGDF